MMWISGKEQAMLTALGVAAVVGLGMLGWQRRSPPPLVLERGALNPAESVGQALAEQPVAAVPAARSHRRPATRTVDPTQAASWDRALSAARRVDVNTAGASELERLPHVGPALAERIVAYREAHGPFLTTEDLLRVRGVGAATLEALRDRVTLDGGSE